ITTATPAYQWGAVAGSTWYQLWVNGPSGTVVQQWYTNQQANCPGGAGTCSVTPTVQLQNGAHQWWVQTYDASGYGPWSAAKAFTVVIPPPAPTLISPTGTIGTRTPAYRWNAASGATGYDL